VDTVLLVEDDGELRRMFRTALSFAGYRVVEAGDGLVALQVLDATSPDLIVLDLGLPDIDGLEVIRHIREAGVAPPTKGLSSQNILKPNKKPKTNLKSFTKIK
jgi:two-component system KDP operon response regulator KdpE